MPEPGGFSSQGQRLYAIGDIHGCHQTLERLLGRIAEDQAAHPPRAGEQAQQLIFLGDYIDRGPDARAVIETLIALTDQHGAVCLKGNHEWAMERFLSSQLDYSTWQLWGGDATLRSYGVEPLKPAEAAAPPEQASLRQRLRQRVPATHQAFLQGLPLSHRVGDYLFVHAGIRPGIPLEKQDPQDLLMIREPFLSQPVTLPLRVVHGHTIVPEPCIQDQRIGVDTGAFHTGVLTAAVIEADQVRFIHT